MTEPIVMGANSARLIFKRAFDIFAAGTGLFVLTPVMLLVALAVRLSSRGPILYRQTRIGQNFQPFQIIKFRTMSHGSEGPSITIGGDARITRIGAVLRAMKLDELPQLWNVLRGDMSLVGPRPEVPQYVNLFKDDYGVILRVRPGITDFATFLYRDEEKLLADSSDPEREYISVILPRKIGLAKHYVRRAGLAFDLGILLKTVVSIVWQRTLPAHRLLLKRGRLISVVLHLLMTGLVYYASWWLRFDGFIPHREQEVMWTVFPVLIGVRGIVLYFFRLYEGLWRYTDIWDVEKIFLGVLISQGIVVVIVRFGFEIYVFPRAVFMLDATLFMFLMIAARLVRRAYDGLGRFQPICRSVIVGANPAAELLAHALRASGSTDRHVVGLVGMGLENVGRHIHGVPVLGAIPDLPRVLQRDNVDEVIVAGFLAESLLTFVRESAQARDVKVTTAPDLLTLLDPVIDRPPTLQPEVRLQGRR